MSKFRDDRGKFVRADDRAYDDAVMQFPSEGRGWTAGASVTLLIMAFAVGVLCAWAWPKPVLQPLPARIIVEQAEPIDWANITVRAIPEKDWQEDHDRTLISRIGLELQRVIDLNEQRDEPAFPKHH